MTLKNYECILNKRQECKGQCVRNGILQFRSEVKLCLMYRQKPEAATDAPNVPVEERPVESQGRAEDHSTSDDKGKSPAPNKAARRAHKVKRKMAARKNVHKGGEAVCPK